MKRPDRVRDTHIPSNTAPYLPVRVVVRSYDGQTLKEYVMNYEAPNERAVLGEQAFAAIRARQSITTTPL